jgi:hypothetical protein
MGLMYFAKIPLVTEAIVLSMGISSGRSGQAERGKYLLEEVGNCQECYSSDIADSQFQPKQPVKAWYEKAPGLTPGSRLWQRWGENGLVTFLETGLGPTGHGADPPIPTYKLKHEDAQAIVDYLKSPK